MNTEPTFENVKKTAITVAVLTLLTIPIWGIWKETPPFWAYVTYAGIAFFIGTAWGKARRFNTKEAYADLHRDVIRAWVVLTFVILFLM